MTGRFFSIALAPSADATVVRKWRRVPVSIEALHLRRNGGLVAYGSAPLRRTIRAQMPQRGEPVSPPLVEPREIEVRVCKPRFEEHRPGVSSDRRFYLLAVFQGDGEVERQRRI